MILLCNIQYSVFLQSRTVQLLILKKSDPLEGTKALLLFCVALQKKRENETWATLQKDDFLLLNNAKANDLMVLLPLKNIPNASYLLVLSAVNHHSIINL